MASILSRPQCVKWMPPNFTNDMSALVQVMAWCRQIQIKVTMWHIRPHKIKPPTNWVLSKIRELLCVTMCVLHSWLYHCVILIIWSPCYSQVAGKYSIFLVVKPCFFPTACLLLICQLSYGLIFRDFSCDWLRNLGNVIFMPGIG